MDIVEPKDTPSHPQPEHPETNMSSAIPPSNQSKNPVVSIISIILLVFIFPIGLLFMWIFAKWSTITKLIVTATGIFLLFLVIPFLLAAALIAINPAKQLKVAHDTKRQADVIQILNAIDQYAAAHGNILPSEIPDSTTGPESIANGPGKADICSLLFPKYLSSLPSDPKAYLSSNSSGEIKDCSNYDTGYMIVKNANNTLTVSAPLSEIGKISVTR